MIRFASPRHARGVSLIEVLVAIVIFSLGLIGLALMQLKGATFTKEASARTMAVLQARSLADRMEANPQGVKDGNYIFNSSTPPTMQVPCPASSVASCTAQNDLAEWIDQIKTSAPASSSTSGNFGKVTNNGDGTYTITVSWNGLIDMTGSGTPTDVSESVVYIPAQIGSGS
ncbi:MAG: type IV pilus modification protein PilV [Terriglobales bacterium]